MNLLTTAKTIDILRIIPRAIVVWYAYLITYLVYWFVALPDPNINQAGFISLAFSTIPIVFNFYVKSGFSWVKRKQQ